MDNESQLSSDRVKHLEFIQAVIARLANDSFLMKGWSLTVAGLIFGFAARESSPGVALVGFLPILVFWGLDAYFLRQERLTQLISFGRARTARKQNISLAFER